MTVFRCVLEVGSQSRIFQVFFLAKDYSQAQQIANFEVFENEKAKIIHFNHAPNWNGELYNELDY